MNRNAIAAVLILSTITQFACAQDSKDAKADDQNALADGVAVHRDLEYARAGGKPLLLDLYLPNDEARTPLVVWIHGGAWRKGEKGSGGRVRWMTEHGYAVADINYRLSQEALFPAQIHDCKAAIRWLRGNAEHYGYDAGRIGVAGSSAGGHLVALLGTSGGVKGLEGDLGSSLDQSSRVQAVCDMWGPTDFLRMGGGHNEANSPESLLIGGAIQENKEKVAIANPITYVTGDDPPFLLLHGDQDGAVRINQSELLKEALDKAGVEAEFHPLEGAGHGGKGFPVSTMNEMMLAFFDRCLRDSGPAESAGIKIFSGEPRLLIAHGYSTSRHYWAFLQRKIDRYMGGSAGRVIEVRLCNKGGTPIARWMNIETGETSRAWDLTFTPMIQAEKGKRPVVVLAQQSLQGVFEQRADGIRGPDDVERIRRGADVIERYGKRILEDGAAAVIIGMHIYKKSMEPEIGYERLALAELMTREPEGIFAGPDVWTPTSKQHPWAFDTDKAHPNYIGAEMMAHYWFAALLEREGLEVPEWSREEMENAIKNAPLGLTRDPEVFEEKLKEWSIISRRPSASPGNDRDRRDAGLQ